MCCLKWFSVPQCEKGWELIFGHSLTSSDFILPPALNSFSSSPLNTMLLIGLLLLLKSIPDIWNELAFIFVWEASNLQDHSTVIFPGNFLGLSGQVGYPSLHSQSILFQNNLLCISLLPWWLRLVETCLQCGRPRFDPWIGKMPEKEMATHSSVLA